MEKNNVFSTITAALCGAAGVWRLDWFMTEEHSPHLSLVDSFRMLALIAFYAVAIAVVGFIGKFLFDSFTKWLGITKKPWQGIVELATCICISTLVIYCLSI